MKIADPNDAGFIFDLEHKSLGIRKVAGAYDNNTEAVLGSIGDPGNSDGFPSGAPPTTTTSDFTDVVVTPGDFALARNVFGMVYLNPGDTIASVTAIGVTGGGEVFVGNSQTILGGVLPILPFTENDARGFFDRGEPVCSESWTQPCVRGNKPLEFTSTAILN